MNNAQLINQDSGDTEYYTPPEIIEAAREVMGTIDFDPASSEQANRNIKARVFVDCKGLSCDWFGNVWMNHPFKRGENHKWINKIVDSYENGDVNQACCITYAATSENWFQPLLEYPQCYLTPRTNYYLPNGERKRRN